MDKNNKDNINKIDKIEKTEDEQGNDDEITGVFEPPEMQPPKEPDCPVCSKTLGGKVKFADYDFLNNIVHIEGCPSCKTCFLVVIQPKIYRKKPDTKQ